MNELSQIADKDLDEKESAEKNERLAEISERLETICANECEAKAIKILTGIGFG